MPWDYKSGNIPTSMKYLKPSIQKKAISIANHVLLSTGDEGKAIAVGISKAKSVHDKKGSLVKLAFILHGATLGALAGNYIGGSIGKNEKKRDKNSLIGAWIGGAAGAIGGTAARNALFKHQYHYQKVPRPSASKTEIRDFFKEHGRDYTNIKTKLKAKRVYHEAARKYHPDMGGNAEKFKKLSTNWEDIENSGWFNKLAAIHNNVVAKQIFDAIKKGDDKFLTLKYNQIKEYILGAASNSTKFKNEKDLK
jgi:Skp family chaperone for outer membrane proteins